MAYENIIKLAVDTAKRKPTAFSQGKDPTEVIRNAIKEANGGLSKIDYKAIRDGKCPGFFSLVEELITATVIAGLPENNPIFKWVETKNGAEGDKPVFKIHKNTIFAVSKIAAGTQGIRRQRMLGDTTITLVPVLHAVKVYEELDRLLSGQSDWNQFVDDVSNSMILDTNLEIVDAFATGITGANIISLTGYSESTMVNLITEVEMKNPGKTAKIFGTKTALRNLTMTKSGDEVNSDYYNMGYMGKFNGTEVFELKNGYKADGTTKILADNKLYVIASDQKFIKYYNEGETTIINRMPEDNADLTQEQTVMNKSGVAVVISDTIGVCSWT